MTARILTGEFVALEPLVASHASELLEAVLGDRSSYGFVSLPESEEEMQAYVEYALAEAAEGRQLPFVIRDRATGKAVGSTRYARLTYWRWPRGEARAASGPDAVEIGYTWLAGSAQGTVVNAESKLLLLKHAFEAWRVHRVRFRTDVRNQRSQRALEHIGAKFDGVLRGDWPGADGGVRDSAYYSILAAEWPLARRTLQERVEFLAKRADGPPLSSGR